MATKSFTEEYRFTKKNANSLINALSNDKSKIFFLEVIVRWEYRLSV